MAGFGDSDSPARGGMKVARFRKKRETVSDVLSRASEICDGSEPAVWTLGKVITTRSKGRICFIDIEDGAAQMRVCCEWATWKKVLGRR